MARLMMLRVFLSRPTVPDIAPAILGDQLLHVTVEVIGICDGLVDIGCAQDFATGLQSFFKSSLFTAAPFVVV